MGCCASSLTEEQKAAIAESSQLDKVLNAAINDENKVIKLLLLGTGESGKCWLRGTPLLLRSGEIKSVEDIVGGDVLMGDDSTPRTVIPSSLTRGRAWMYRIVPSSPTMVPFGCNREHVLSLRYHEKPSVVQKGPLWTIVRKTPRTVSDQSQAIGVDTSLCDSDGLPLRFGTQREAENESKRLVESGEWRPLEFECTVEDYLKHFGRDAIQNVTLYQPDYVTFPNPKDCLKDRVTRTERSVSEEMVLETAWIMGVYSTPSVSTENPDVLVKSRVYRWLSAMGCPFLCSHSTALPPLSALPLIPQLFESYQMLTPHQLDLQLLTDSIDVRRHFLCGVLDSGSLLTSDSEYEIVSSNAMYLEGISHLCRGLGLSVKKFGITSIRIFGHRIVSLSSVLTQRMPHRPMKMFDSNEDSLCSPFCISDVGVSDYFGFQLDGNGRCLLGDFTVTHNSTIFKQMQILYQKGFTDFEKTTFRHVIRRNVVESMQTLIHGIMRFRLQLSPQGEQAARFMLSLDPLSADFWVQEIVYNIGVLWNARETAVVTAYKMRSKMQLLDSAQYLFDNVARIGAPDYVPTQDDILRARLRTSGIVERIIPINGVDFKFLDVGGQRNERRKWIHCFDSEHQILTSDGFKWFNDAEGVLMSDVATYNPITQQIEYVPGSDVTFIENHSDSEGFPMIDCVDSDGAKEWGSNADKYGHTNSDDDSIEAEEAHVCLSTTADHDWYVVQEPDTSALNVSTQKDLRRKITGQQLVEDGKSVKLLCVAKGGVSVADSDEWQYYSSNEFPFHSVLELKDIKEVRAFIRLYGYWVGKGAVEFQSSKDRLVFFSENSADEEFLSKNFHDAGLVYECGIHSSAGHQYFSIGKQPWVEYFFGEYGVRDAEKDSGDTTAKWMSHWVFKLGKKMSDLLLEGLEAAVGSGKVNHRVSTSSARLRDEIVRVCLHAGYTSHFKASKREGGRMWSVFWSSAAKSTEPTLCPHRGEFVLRDERYKGSTYCVNVPHNLIIARRAHRDDSNVITKVSSPVVIGNCFDQVTAVIFVAAISEYDQVLYEDEKENRLHESIRVFESVCNNKYFSDTAMILFMNKIDLFEQKVRQISIRCCFPEYSGPDTREEASEYIRDRFLEQNKMNKLVFSHITCATDTDNVQRVFEACRIVILQENLRKLGLS